MFDHFVGLVLKELNLKDLGYFFRVFSSNNAKNTKHNQGLTQEFTIETVPELGIFNNRERRSGGPIYDPEFCHIYCLMLPYLLSDTFLETG